MTLTPTSQRPMFTEQQRKALKNLGLFDEQIEAINDVLPMCKFSVKKTPAKDSVRRKIRKLEKSVHQAQRAFSKFLGDSTAAGEEAIQRVTLADFEFWRHMGSVTECESVESLLGRLGPVQLILRKALQKVSNEEQRRHRPSSPFPIQVLNDALRHGWAKHQPPGRLTNPDFNWQVSLTKMPFPEIARIFYEAIGQNYKDLERPIKAYLAFTNKQTVRRHQELGFASGSVGQKKTAPKSGRQPNKKTNLPS